MLAPTASARIKVNAAPSRVYALITDLPSFAELTDETASMRWRRGTQATVGAVFKGANRNGWRRWTTTCTVTDATVGSRFAFEVSHTGIPISRWQYDIVDTADGCVVTEQTWDRRPRWFKAPAAWFTGVKDRTGANAAHMRATLDRLKARAETS